jgi:hypothetical protein
MTTRSRAATCCLAGLLCVLSVRAQGQVTAQRLVDASAEPESWPTYSGSYLSRVR